MNPIIKAGAVIGAVMTLGGAAVAVGYQFDRPVWHSEFQMVANDVYEDQLRRAMTRYYHLDREKKQYEREGHTAPPNLLAEWNHWAREIDRLKKLLGRKR
jgi:hypothetical protein|tara:strand:- start:10065 stop:10364 length:300 start_codon:yes stop_codon:yes gene_type:complete